jgi:hypothetical protein
MGASHGKVQSLVDDIPGPICPGNQYYPIAGFYFKKEKIRTLLIGGTLLWISVFNGDGWNQKVAIIF